MSVPNYYKLSYTACHYFNINPKVIAFKLLQFALIFNFIQQELYAQVSSSSSKTAIFNENSFKEYNAESISSESFFKLKNEALGLDNCDMVLINSNRLKSDFIHLKYQQYYKGIPIYNSMYYLHTKDGEVKSSNGMLYPFIEIKTEPNLNEQRANQIVQKYFLTIINEKNVDYNDVTIISTELFITDKNYPNFSGNYVLVYRIIATINSINKKQEILVDAYNGQIIFNQSKIHEIDRPSKAKTKYYGEQDILI
jgi:Zn-dependent metalloprotease